MNIVSLKINGTINPIGFDFTNIFASWKVENTLAKRQQNAVVEVARDAEFTDIVCKVEDANSLETEICIKDLQPRTRYFWHVTVTADNGESAVSEVAYFETGKMNEAWQGRWIAATEDDKFHPVFKKKFNADKEISDAKLYICGLGAFEAYMNGKKIGDDFLAPFLTDYVECYQAITYDVTDMLSSINELEIYLGKSWYMSKFGLALKENNFGDHMMTIAELHVLYTDGSSDIIATDDSWEYRGSDIEDSGIYFGEILNRQLWASKENPWKKPIITAPSAKLVDRFGVSVKVMEDIHVAEIINTPAGETVLDFGQNHAGYMEFVADFPAGTTVKLEVGEVLQEGNFYHDNYRDAESVFIYTSNGTKETVRPHFTFYGYRYVKVTGWVGELTTESIVSKVIYSDIERTGYIETSNEKINKLYANAVWGQKSNFVDIPTDCPQRSERLGWTGDTQVFAATASYNMDTRAFYSKFLRDLRSEQLRANGAVANYFPTFAEGGESSGASVWADVATIVPNVLMNMFGSVKMMKEFYPLMKDWVEFLHGRDIREGDKGIYENAFTFGDWLALDGVTEQSFKGATDDAFLHSAYYYNSINILATIAKELFAVTCDNQYKDDAATYAALADKARNAFLDKYVTPGGRLSMDTQAGYIVALRFGLYRDKDVMINQFKERLRKDCYQIKCGFVGAPLLCMTLCELGMTDIAYHFLFNEGFPSWLYCVNLGATTIWERWNSLLPDGTISGTGMNSLNHYAYGSVVEFFYAYIAGIRAVEYGYKKAIVAPEPSMKFRHFDCTFNSAAGRYVSNWKINEDGSFSMHVEVPFDCEANVILPRYNGQDIEFSESIPESEVGKESELVIYEDGSMVLGTGKYDFTYMPSEDYRLIYGPKTRLSEVKDDEEAMEILKEKLPVGYGMIMSKDIENLNLTFEEMKYMFFFGFTPEAVEAATADLFKLNRY